MLSNTNPGSWREYQSRLQRITRKKYLVGRLPRLGLYAGSSFLIMVIILYGGSWLFAHLDRMDKPPPGNESSGNVEPESLAKVDLPAILRDLDLDFLPETGKQILSANGKNYTVETFLDRALQNYILNLLKRSLTYRAAVVVLRPRSGQVLAMAHYEKQETGKEENLCLSADFPAASLFKIVSAAAAIESKGFTPDKTLVFRGRKHTLYRSQLKKGEDRYGTKISFKKAFSGSINPVFGKIGIYNLGREVMTEYGNRFFFNREIPFELRLGQSRVHVPEDEFGMAEIASGFNKKTMISPLHAALLTATIANNGIMMEPNLIKRVRDESDKILYNARFMELGRPINKDTASILKVLMEDTVKNGTSRKAFRTFRRNKLFEDIKMGAKTGTINDPLDQYKYDWITVYAIPDQGVGGISIAVLAVHGEKLGIRSKDLAGYIIKYHFTS